MIRIATLLAIAISSINAAPPESSECSVSMKGKDKTYALPLVLVPRGQPISFLYPESNDGMLVFGKDAKVRLACVGNNNFITNLGDNRTQDIELYCVKGTKFRMSLAIGSPEYEFGNLKCQDPPAFTIQDTGRDCPNNTGARELEIGFNVIGEFLRTILLCEDRHTKVTYWTKFKLTKAIKGRQVLGRGRFKVSPFMSEFDFEHLYDKNTQPVTVSLILGSAECGRKYINTVPGSKARYLNRGHLASSADFFYDAAQKATFYYDNCPPQWNTINCGNWQRLEDQIQKYANDKKVDLDIYTGAHDIMTLPDVNNKEQGIFLYAVEEKRALPVPKFFWKIVYDPAVNKGTAFVGVNNPYITNDQIGSYTICTSISNTIKWIDWKNINNGILKNGFMYACTVDDLRSKVSTFPDLTVGGVLT